MSFLSALTSESKPGEATLLGDWSLMEVEVAWMQWGFFGGRGDGVCVCSVLGSMHGFPPLRWADLEGSGLRAPWCANLHVSPALQQLAGLRQV